MEVAEAGVLEFHKSGLLHCLARDIHPQPREFEKSAQLPESNRSDSDVHGVVSFWFEDKGLQGNAVGVLFGGLCFMACVHHSTAFSIRVSRSHSGSSVSG